MSACSCSCVFFSPYTPSRRRLNNDGRNGHLQPQKIGTNHNSQLREGFFQGFGCTWLFRFLPNARKSKNLAQTQGGSRSQRGLTWHKRELRGENGLTSSQPERRQKTPPGLLFFS